MRFAIVWGSTLLFVGVGAAHGQELRSGKNLDGWAVTLGPVVAAERRGGLWDSAAGLELSLVHLSEDRHPALWGVSMGATALGKEQGGLAWLEGELAWQHILPFDFGLAAGPWVALDPVAPPRLGAGATFWVFAGVIPYVRVGWLKGEDAPLIQAGVMIKLPVLSFR